MLPAVGGRRPPAAARWWPGDTRHRNAGFYAYAHPAPEGFATGTLEPDAATGTATSASSSSGGTISHNRQRAHSAIDFAFSAFRHACASCDWDPALAATAEGRPPPDA